jgi:hypothetical protein
MLLRVVEKSAPSLDVVLDHPLDKCLDHPLDDHPYQK